jgi:hypothetical protein
MMRRRRGERDPEWQEEPRDIEGRTSEQCRLLKIMTKRNTGDGRQSALVGMIEENMMGLSGAAARRGPEVLESFKEAKKTHSRRNSV